MGCTINLVRKDAAKQVASRVSQQYLQETGIEMETYEVAVCNGTETLKRKKGTNV